MVMDVSGFFAEVDRAPSERALAIATMDRGTALTGALAIGFYLLVDETKPREMYLRGLSEQTAEFYEDQGRAVDPMYQSVRALHAPAVLDIEAAIHHAPHLRALRSEASRVHPDVAYSMIVPIVVGTSVAGAVHFASTREHPLEASLGSAIALHLSSRMAVLRSLDGFAVAWDGALTSREQEVAVLAARGLSTAEMACAAGITSNTVKKHLKQLYAKLGVSSRAELSSMLLRGPRALRDEGSSRRLRRTAWTGAGDPCWVHLHEDEGRARGA